MPPGVMTELLRTVPMATTMLLGERTGYKPVLERFTVKQAPTKSVAARTAA